MSTLYSQSLTRVRYLITPQIYNPPGHFDAIESLNLPRSIAEDIHNFPTSISPMLLSTEGKLPPQLQEELNRIKLLSWDWSKNEPLPIQLYNTLNNWDNNKHRYFHIGCEDIWHVNFNYYYLEEEDVINGGFLNVCFFCILNMLVDGEDPTFYVFDRHVKINGYEIEPINFFQNKKNWCAVCLTQPLFTIYTPEECEQRVNYYYSESDSDSGSD